MPRFAQALLIVSIATVMATRDHGYGIVCVLGVVNIMSVLVMNGISPLSADPISRVDEELARMILTRIVRLLLLATAKPNFTSSLKSYYPVLQF